MNRSNPKPAVKGQQKPRQKPPQTKQDILLALLRRKKGATLAELQKASKWQAHSIRGFLSGTVKKKMGLSLNVAEDDHRGRFYTINDKA